MRHYIFPTVSQADAFAQELIRQGVVSPELGNTSFRRRQVAQTTPTTQVVTEVVEGGGDSHDVAAGAVKGTAVGAVAGAVAGAAAVALTGGLALVPVLLGMGAVGSAVGAAAGAADGAVHGDGLTERAQARRYEEAYDLDDDRYNELSTAVGTEGRVVAVEDAVPVDVADAAAAQHGGRRA